MFNPRLTETLTDFPFARLNALLAPIAPPAHLSMINMSVGEPQGAMPAFARQIVIDEVDGWNRYPPNQGLPELNVAICAWLTRRYKLPKGLLDPDRHCHPTAGSKEGVYIIATIGTPQEKAGGKPVALRELLSQSDVISLHCPSTAQTRGMVNRDSLAITRRGVILINVARGDLVDSAALTEALQNGHVSAAALDVFAPEPIPADHPILKMDNVIVASHIASCSVPAVRKLRETAANLAAMALRGDVLPNVVNGVGK